MKIENGILIEESQQTRQLGEKSVGKLLLNFSIPAVLSTLINSLYNVVDRIFVGQWVGETALAAITVAFPIMMIVMAIGMMIAFGSNALISIRLGEKKKEEAEKILGQAFLLYLLFSFFFTISGIIFLEPLLKFFGATETILPSASEYTFIILLGILPNEISFGVNSFIRGEGNPNRAMQTTFIGACLNIFLDYVFIRIFGWGIKGAAYATVLSMSIAAMYVFFYYFNGKSVLKFHLKNFVLKYELVKSVIIIGSPPCFMHIVSSFIQALMNNRLAQYGGDLAIAVMGVVWTVVMILLMPIIGVCLGAQPILGYNYGAGNYERVKQTFILTLKTATLICFGGWLILEFFPEYILVLFNKSEEFVSMGTEAMQTIMVVIPLVGIPIVTSQYYQALGKPMFSLFLSLMRQTIILIPFIYILPKYYGLRGVWWAVPASDIGSFAVAVIFVFFEMKKLSEKSV